MRTWWSMCFRRWQCGSGCWCFRSGYVILNIDAGCQKRVARNVMQEVQRATRSSLLQCLHPAGTDADPIPQLDLIRPSSCKSALRKWHMPQNVCRCDSDAGTV